MLGSWDPTHSFGETVWPWRCEQEHYRLFYAVPSLMRASWQKPLYHPSPKVTPKWASDLPAPTSHWHHSCTPTAASTVPSIPHSFSAEPLPEGDTLHCSWPQNWPDSSIYNNRCIEVRCCCQTEVLRVDAWLVNVLLPAMLPASIHEEQNAQLTCNGSKPQGEWKLCYHKLQRLRGLLTSFQNWLLLSTSPSPQTYLQRAAEFSQK